LPRQLVQKAMAAVRRAAAFGIPDQYYKSNDITSRMAKEK
jgi:hypothetical protein